MMKIRNKNFAPHGGQDWLLPARSLLNKGCLPGEKVLPIS
jgi:hypothetical protein